MRLDSLPLLSRASGGFVRLLNSASRKVGAAPISYGGKLCWKGRPRTTARERATPRPEPRLEPTTSERSSNEEGIALELSCCLTVAGGLVGQRLADRRLEEGGTTG